MKIERDFKFQTVKEPLKNFETNPPCSEEKSDFSKVVSPFALTKSSQGQAYERRSHGIQKRDKTYSKLTGQNLAMAETRLS